MAREYEKFESITLNGKIISTKDLKVEKGKLQRAIIGIRIDHNPTISTEGKTLYVGSIALEKEKAFPILLFKAENFQNYAIIQAEVEREEYIPEKEFDIFFSAVKNWNLHISSREKFIIKIAKNTSDKVIRKRVKEAFEDLNRTIYNTKRTAVDKLLGEKDYDIYMEKDIKEAIEEAIERRDRIIGDYNANEDIDKVRIGEEVWVTIPMSIVVKY
jgi:hypothetical protein